MKPSGWWTLLLTLCTPDDAREAVLGDFFEEYADRAASSRSAADAWYRRQILCSIPSLLVSRGGRRRFSGVWRDAIAVLLATISAIGCLAIGNFAIAGPFAQMLREYGWFGYSEMFWINILIVSAGAVIAGWVALQIAGRADLRIGFALAITWVLATIGPLLAQGLVPNSGTVILCCAVAPAAIVGAVARAVWATRGLRAAR